MRTIQLFVRAGGLLAVLAVCLVAISPLSGFAQTAPALGTWKLNPAKSKSSPGPPAKEQTLTYEATGDSMKLTAKGTDGQGQPIDNQYTAKYDGKDYPVTGNPNWDSISLKRINANKVEFTRKKAGKVVGAGTRVVSKDGKILTITAKGFNTKGEKTSSTAVYDKQ